MHHPHALTIAHPTRTLTRVPAHTHTERALTPNAHSHAERANSHELPAARPCGAISGRGLVRPTRILHTPVLPPVLEEQRLEVGQAVLLVLDSGFGVEGLEFRVQALGFRVEGLEFGV